MNENFINGLISGLCAPAMAILPSEITTVVDASVLESSYRGPETDYENLKKDFEVAIGKAEKEIKNEKKHANS